MTGTTTRGWSFRGPTILGALSLAILIGGLGTWSITARLSGAILATGTLTASFDQQIVQHETGGRVAQVLVREGDRISAGDPILQLDNPQLRTELRLIEQQYFDLIARRARFSAELDGTDIAFPPELTDAAETRPDVAEMLSGQRQIAQLRRAAWAHQIKQRDLILDQINSQTRALSVQSQSLADQYALIDAQLRDQSALHDRGLAPASRIAALRREKARLDGAIAEVTAQQAQIQVQRIATEVETKTIQVERHEKIAADLRDLSLRALDLRDRRDALTDQVAALTIVAPTDGIVHDLQIKGAQSIIAAGAPIMTLLPKGPPMLVRAEVSPTQIDQISLGQGVRIQMASLSFAELPPLYGTVTQISADAISTDDAPRPLFHVGIAFDPDSRETLTSVETLSPGLPVQLFFRTRDHSPLTYLLKPVHRYFARALREG